MIRLILFCVVGMLATEGTSMAENTSTCPVDTVPIQIIRGAEPLAVTRLSDTRIADFPPGFTAFVTAATEHIAAKLGQDKLCLNSVESKERSLIQFVSWTIISHSHPLHSMPPSDVQSSGVSRISSPWIDLVIEREPVPSVRAIVRYSERQLLTDQAVLAGARNVPPGVALPITESEFERYADLWSRSLGILGRFALKPIEEQVPPDLLWLFRRAWQDSDGSFSGPAVASIRKAMTSGSEGYTKIVIALIDHCLASDGVDIQYNSVLDLADLIPLEKYKIVTSIIVKPIDF